MNKIVTSFASCVAFLCSGTLGAKPISVDVQLPLDGTFEATRNKLEDMAHASLAEKGLYIEYFEEYTVVESSRGLDVQLTRTKQIVGCIVVLKKKFRQIGDELRLRLKARVIDERFSEVINVVDTDPLQGREPLPSDIGIVDF